MMERRWNTLPLCHAPGDLNPGLLLRCLLAIVVLLGLSGSAGPASPAKKAPSRPESNVPAKPLSPGPLVLEDKPEPFVPRTPRTEADEDRVEALGLFSAARLHEQRRELAEALRLYERALRCDPQSATIARAVVTLAARLDRHGEAVRYALKLVELEEVDPLLLRRLGVYLTEEGDWPRALGFFEKAVAARKTAKPTAEDVLRWMEMGRLYHLTAEYDKAADAFAQVLDALDHPERFGLNERFKKMLLGDPGHAWNLIGESFFLAGRFPQAAAAFEKGHRAAPNQQLLDYQLTRIDARSGHPDKALQRLQAGFDARPAALWAELAEGLAQGWTLGKPMTAVGPVLPASLQDAGEGMAPYRLLADLLKTLHKETELIARLEALRARDPNNVFVAHFLAEKYLEGKQADKAEALYGALVVRWPSIAGYRNLLEIYRKAKRYDALLKVLGEAIAHVGALDPLAEKGHALAEDKELVKRVVRTARAQLNADPKGCPYESRVAAALLALEAKQYDAAAEFYRAAIEAKPDHAERLYKSWGLGLVRREQYARAVEVFRRALDQKAPADDPTFLYHLAGALEMAGRTDEALAAARKAVELAAAGEAGRKPAPAAPDRPDLLSCRTRVAWLLYHGKRYDEAAMAYGELIQKYAFDHDSVGIPETVREFRLAMSNIAVSQHDTARAVDWLEQVLDEFPEDPAALNDLGYLWAEQGKHLDRAHRMIEKAVEKDPDNAAYRDSLGWVLFQKGRIREALPELEKAAATEPEPTVLDHLGDAYRALGQAEKAKDAWRRAIEAFKKNPDAEKMKQVEAKIKANP